MKKGNVATGEDFFNRTKDIQRLWRLIPDDHTVLSGPRRLGKTSLLYKLLEDAETHGYEAKVMDVSAERNPVSFIEVLSKHFHSQTVRKRFRSLVDLLNPKKHLKKVDATVLGEGIGIEFKDPETPTWQEIGDYCLSSLAEKKCLILVDEFSVFLQKLIETNVEEATDFLDWLRTWRNKPTFQSRFIFTGSIGLQSLLERYELDTKINDCEDYQLQAFEKTDACEMLITFAKHDGWNVNSDIAEFICQKVGWLSPYFLNLLLDETMQEAESRVSSQLQNSAETNQVITKSDIQNAYDKLLTRRSKFSHWKKRLKEQFDAVQFEFCIKMLTQISQSDIGLNVTQLSTRLSIIQPDHSQREQWIIEVREHLIDEGYLSAPNEEGKVQFLSFLLKDFWRRNHV